MTESIFSWSPLSFCSISFLCAMSSMDVDSYSHPNWNALVMKSLAMIFSSFCLKSATHIAQFLGSVVLFVLFEKATVLFLCNFNPFHSFSFFNPSMKMNPFYLVRFWVLKKGLNLYKILVSKDLAPKPIGFYYKNRKNIVTYGTC